MSDLKYKLMPFPPTEEMKKASGNTPGMKEVDGCVTLAAVHGFKLTYPERGEPPPIVQAYQAMWEAAPSPEGGTPGVSIPQDIQEWIWHLELHLTEHDTHHAGLALRAAYPAVRDFFTSVRTSLIQVNNRCKELERERNALLAKLEGKKS